MAHAFIHTRNFSQYFFFFHSNKSLNWGSFDLIPNALIVLNQLNEICFFFVKPNINRAQDVFSRHFKNLIWSQPMQTIRFDPKSTKHENDKIKLKNLTNKKKHCGFTIVIHNTWVLCYKTNGNNKCYKSEYWICIVYKRIIRLYNIFIAQHFCSGTWWDKQIWFTPFCQLHEYHSNLKSLKSLKKYRWNVGSNHKDMKFF